MLTLVKPLKLFLKNRDHCGSDSILFVYIILIDICLLIKQFSTGIVTF